MSEVLKNKTIRLVLVIVFICAFLFSFAFNCFASQFEYGAFDFQHMSIAESSLTRLLYSTFGSVRYHLFAIDGLGNRSGTCGFVFRSFAVTDTPNYSTSKFFQFIGNNAMNLLMSTAFNIEGDYMEYANVNSDDVIHIQFSFSCDQQVDLITISGSYTDPGTSGNGNITIAAISSWDGQKVSRSGDLYIIDFDYTPVTSLNYITIDITASSSNKDYAKITVDKSLVPYWSRSNDAGGSPISNYYNITQNYGGSVDLSGIYEYLDLVTEWLNLISQENIDELETLTNMYSDIISRLNQITGSLSSINGNVSSIFTITSGIRDRINTITSQLTNMTYYLDDMYQLQDSYLPYLESIYDILNDILDSVTDIEQRFVEWTNNQNVGIINPTNMKTFISSIFGYVKNFFRYAFDFTSGILNRNPFGSFLRFNGQLMFGE